MTDVTSPDDATTDERVRPWARGLMLIGFGLFAAFWIWALFFASKEAVNKIGDEAWAQRAEQICAEAEQARLALVIDDTGELPIETRAELVDRSTDILTTMLDDVVAVEPSDEKGQAIVPMWEEEYRMYLGDRRTYADRLRETGEYSPFYESVVESLPVSERLATFAGDNDMPSCSPPYDLSG